MKMLIVNCSVNMLMVNTNQSFFLNKKPLSLLNSYIIITNLEKSSVFPP